MRGKIQKNDYGNHMLVEADKSTNLHIGPGDWHEIEPMTDDEIIKEYLQRVPNPTVEIAKDYLKGVDGFCKSNVTANDGSYTYGDLFKVIKNKK